MDTQECFCNVIRSKSIVVIALTLLSNCYLFNANPANYCDAKLVPLRPELFNLARGKFPSRILLNKLHNINEL